jgi:putative ABC transport system permease protein
VLDIPLLAGKTLPETKDPNDTTVQIIVNKATLDYLGLTPEQAIGKRVNVQGFNELTDIVGVMDDFHFTSLHQQIGPFCFHNSTRSERYNYLLVKVNTGNLAGTVKQLENIYNKNVTASFEYTFLDQHLNNLYRSEQNLSQVVMLLQAWLFL